MNLTSDAWIPIVWNGGRPDTVSLNELFERGKEIQDLALRPHERIALMRLLICISQAALDGPNDYHDWQTCGPKIAPAALEYLDQWRAAFELFGDGPRFLQVPNLTKNPKKSSSDSNEEEGESLASKLDMAFATGNNATLFDNGGGSDRDFQPAQVALMLLTFQCFSPGGRIGVALWDGEKTAGAGSSHHAPCLADGTLHTFLRCENLLATLHRNLLSKTQADQFLGDQRWGKPVWVWMPRSPGDSNPIRNANRTYLGRLVPLARAIRLSEDGCSLILANGLDYATYADGWREPCATIVTRNVRGEPKRVVLPASNEKAIWRELHALTVKAVGQKPGGPAGLRNIPEEENGFDLWAGGLVANKAKPVDTTESLFHVPSAMLDLASQTIYENGVKCAETTELRIMRAVSVYHKELGDNLDRPEMRNRRRQIQRNAVAQFWTDIEQAVPFLLEAAEGRGLGPKGDDWRDTAWGQSVWRSARAAYDRSCPHDTSRQMRAYALGLPEFFRRAHPGATAIEEETQE